MSTKQISEIVKSVYPYYSKYNDTLTTSRKLKFMINGHDFGTEQYQKWEKEINEKLVSAGIKVNSAKFEVCWSHRGDYYAFIVRVPK